MLCFHDNYGIQKMGHIYFKIPNQSLWRDNDLSGNMLAMSWLNVVFSTFQGKIVWVHGII